MGPSLDNLKAVRAEDRAWGGAFLGAVALQPSIRILPSAGTRGRGLRPCRRSASVISTNHRPVGCGCGSSRLNGGKPWLTARWMTPAISG